MQCGSVWQVICNGHAATASGCFMCAEGTAVLVALPFCLQVTFGWCIHRVPCCSMLRCRYIRGSMTTKIIPGGQNEPWRNICEKLQMEYCMITCKGPPSCKVNTPILIANSKKYFANLFCLKIAHCSFEVRQQAPLLSCKISWYCTHSAIAVALPICFSIFVLLSIVYWEQIILRYAIRAREVFQNAILFFLYPPPWHV